MNKVILIGRFTKDPEIRYSQSADPLAITRFTIAVNRRFKRQEDRREGEPDADFIQCVAFGKLGEFAGKYFTKGKLAVITGRLQVSSWEDSSGQRRWSTEVVVEELEFGESKASSEAAGVQLPVNKPAPSKSNSEPEGFYQIEESVDDDDLPF